MSRTKIERKEIYKILWLLVRGGIAGSLAIGWCLYNIVIKFFMAFHPPRYYAPGEAEYESYYKSNTIEYGLFFNLLWGGIVIIIGIFIFYFYFKLLTLFLSEKKVIKKILLLLACMIILFIFFFTDIVVFVVIGGQDVLFNILYFLGIYHYAD